MPSVPLSEQSFWFHWFLFCKRETLLLILLPKHLADLTPQVILYPICRRKKLWLSAVSPAVSASVWQAISNSSASSIQPSEKPALSLPVILWSSLSSDYSLAKNAQNLSGLPLQWLWSDFISCASQMDFLSEKEICSYWYAHFYFHCTYWSSTTFLQK